MSNTDERRWQQRLDTFGTPLGQLTNACEREWYDYLELAGLIKTFEFSFELSWEVLKDLLFYEGHDVKTPRAVIRKSCEVDYIDERGCAARTAARPGSVSRADFFHALADQLARMGGSA